MQAENGVEVNGNDMQAMLFWLWYLLSLTFARHCHFAEFQTKSFSEASQAIETFHLDLSTFTIYLVSLSVVI